MDTIDHKFGLPQPDFQALPKKKVIWPILVTVAVIVMVIMAKMGYNSYIKMLGQKNTIPALDTTSNSADAPPQLAHSSQMDSNVHQGVNASVGDQSAFEDKKSTKIKESISATQEQLAIKQNKPLVKPGTYQVLSEPQGIYHLVVVSYLDKRSAMKVVQQFMKKKQGVCLILPRINKNKTEMYYRVTIGHSKTESEAKEKLKQFKSRYPQIFVLKY
ncbi:SPOR domain-containing protein [Cardinium endosymbiont of Bemisia tabaci]|uniref:SPOR domain-containing protein n=1 Tax=Candidatus Cardinium TaxID=273135 RepID=UPI000442D062|nr:SPOR domain-containing protein [Cardinium endosymbiont of Bemisia tabaci]CDG49830.1 Sporulation domain-containing protein [Cardinium endosymbiont cBtQ1 of Bemisia tabaci]